MLPGPHARWFNELAGREPPEEPRATCGDCAMLEGKPDLPPEGPLSAKTTCCTWQPHLPAWSVGALLEDAGERSARSRGLIEARIANRAGVSPLGLAPLPEMAAKLARINETPGAFGRDESAECPFHDQAGCSIWANRGVVCASFHCKRERGAYGAWLWQRILLVMHQLERAASRHLLARAGLSPEACDAALRAPEDPAVDAAAWGAWRGRERDFFLEANREIAKLDWPALRAFDPDLAPLEPGMREVFAQLELGPLPARVSRNPQALVQLGVSGARVFNPSLPFDLLEIPPEPSEALGFSASGIAPREGPIDAASITRDPALLRRLLDWQLLIAEP